MAVTTIEHTINCSEDTFWDKLFLDDAFNQRLYKQALKFPGFNQVKTEDTAKEAHRTIEITPSVGELPGAIKKVLGDNMSYTEEGVLDKQSRRYRMQIKPHTLPDKISMKGELWTEPAGPNKLKRIFKAEVTCKVFGIGGMLEKLIISEMEKSYDVAAKFTNEYVAENSL
jgi:hypothetical protein